MTSPIIRCLKKQVGAEVHYLTKDKFSAIVTSNPYIDKVYTIKKRVREVLPALRKERYDYIIDLHKNLRTFLIKLQLPFVKSASFNKLNIEKWLLVHFKIDLLPNRHIVDRYMDGIQRLGVVNDGAGLDFFIAENTAPLKKLLPNKAFIALVVGAGRTTKALTTIQISKLINQSQEAFVLLGGKAEISKAEDILEAVNRPITNLVGQLSLAQSALCVKMAKQIITGDTGLMHIAAAFHKTILSVWGNTIPEFGMYPYYGNQPNKAKIIQVPTLSCRPCSKIGFDQCPKGHFKCIKNIDSSLFK